MKFKIFIFFSILITGTLSRALAKDSDSLSILRVRVQNGDYLNKIQNPSSDPSMQSIVFDHNISIEMSDKYNQINRDYEMRKNYQLGGIENQIQFQNNDQTMMEWSMKRIIQYHFERIMKEARESSQGAGGSSSVRSVLMAAHTLQNPAFNIGENIKTALKYDLPGRRVNLGLTNPLVNGNVNYAMGHQDPVMGTGAMSNQLSVGLNKNLSLISTHAQLRYGVMDQSLYYGASKHIVGPLSTQVGQTRYPSSIGGTETVGQLSIGFGF